MKVTRVRRLCTFILLGVLVAGCSKVGGPSGTIPGTLRVAIQAEPKNLNPLLASNTTDVMIDRLMFEPLVTADPSGNPVPMLATVVPTIENGGISKDGLTITYHLHSDATWTDGVPVTSTDVAFSWKAMMNPDNNVITRHGYDEVRSVETPDGHTVVFHLKERFAPFVSTVFAESDGPIEIVPAHVLARYPNVNQIPFNAAPMVSDGPFKFASWARGDHIELTANDGFFLGKPKLAHIIIKPIPDENTSVNQLRTHEIDWIFQGSLQNYPALKSIPNIDLRVSRYNGYEGVWLNTSRPLLRDVTVRRAIAFAIDKQQLISELAYGQVKMATEDQPDFLWAYEPNVTIYPHDPAKARALLQQAGWTAGPDGILEKNGQRLSLTLVTNNSNVTRRRASVLLQAMLKSVGIDIHLRYYPGSVLFAPAGEGGILQGGAFDLGLAAWIAGIDPDDSSNFTCKNRAPAGYNYSRYCTAEMDDAQQVALTHYDHPTRKAAYAKVQRLLASDVPEIFFWWNQLLQPMSPDFKGFDPNPVVETWNAQEWSI